MASPASGIRASIVVPTFNRSKLISKTLEALFQQDCDFAYEVLVVDDGSSDETMVVLEEWCRKNPGRMRAFHQENSGPARARNRGAREALGGFVAFVDDDCVAEPSWLRRLEAALGAGCDAVAGSVINPQGSWVGRYINRENVIAHVVSPEGFVMELVTGNAGIRASVFEQLGGFDEAIRVAGGEDTEFGLRLRASGRKIAYAPDARVHHDSTVDLRGYLRMIYRHGRGRRRLGERFPEFRMSLPLLRMGWLAWPLRSWMVRDFARYRRGGISPGESLSYLLLRYLENIARLAGYIRGT